MQNNFVEYAIAIIIAIGLLYLIFSDCGVHGWKKKSAQIEKDRKAFNWYVTGGKCPECGCLSSETQPKPHQCKECGTWFNKSHTYRKCNGCGFSVSSNVASVDVEIARGE
jgi:hypothetical protein